MNPPHHRATVLTPPGAGAIAVIKLAGPDPLSILRHIFVGRHDPIRLTDGKIMYGRLVDGEEIIDDVLVSGEQTSASETSIDICCHGGTQIVYRAMELLERFGVVTEADPSFATSHWEAADLIEQEAIAALLGSRTERAARYAAHLRRGLMERVVELTKRWDGNPDAARAELTEMVLAEASARALLGGLMVSLAGPPNTGKSTLLNTLLGRNAVVTSPIAGTTRDWVMESLEFKGVPIDLIDTAGRHDSTDPLEIEAIEGGQSKSRASQAVFLVLDASTQPTDAMWALLDSLRGEIWVVANKSDLGFVWSESAQSHIRARTGRASILVSAKLSTGCEILMDSLLGHWGLLEKVSPAATFLTDRQVHLAKAALSSRDLGSENPIAILLANLAGRAGQAL